eukprot:3944092-Amphidinium_carterae.2
MASMGKNLGLSLGVIDDGKLLDSPVEAFSDASAARAFAERRGLGRQKHVHVRYLWRQEHVANKELQVKKIPTRDNKADFLTKRYLRALRRGCWRAWGSSTGTNEVVFTGS